MPSIEFSSLQKDLKATILRLREIKFADGNVQKLATTFVKELGGEIVPTLLALAEHFNERLEEQDSVVDELMQQSDSFVQPELATQISDGFSSTRALCGLVLGLQTGQLSDVEVKKLHDAAKQTMTSIDAAEAAVEEVTLEYEEAEEPGKQEA